LFRDGLPVKSTTDANDVAIVESVVVGIRGVDRLSLVDAFADLSIDFSAPMSRHISSPSFLAPCGLMDATCNGETTVVDDETDGEVLRMTVLLLLLQEYVEKEFVSLGLYINKRRTITTDATSVDEDRLFFVMAMAAVGNKRFMKRR
jgi:hypothetical protein